MIVEFEISNRRESVIWFGVLGFGLGVGLNMLVRGLEIEWSSKWDWGWEWVRVVDDEG
jgi:hypothetical protein